MKEYDAWKENMKIELDNLVANNFDRLYHSKSSETTKIWGEISGELYKKYDLVDISCTNPKYEMKRKMQHCIFMNIYFYSFEEFPWELSDPRTYRFVKQYGKLPKQAPDEWDKFELEERVKAGEARKLQIKRFKDALNKRYTASQ